MSWKRAWSRRWNSRLKARDSTGFYPEPVREDPHAGPKHFRFSVDPLILVIPLILSCIGLLVITSSSSQIALDSGKNILTSAAAKQALWLMVGMGAMGITYSIPPVFWRRWGGLLWLFAIFLSALTLVPGIGRSAGGARRWINLGILSLQASDVLFFFFVFHAANLLQKRGITERHAFIRMLLLCFVSVVLLQFQPDMGSTLLIFVLGMGLFVESRGWKYPVLVGGSLFAAGIPFIFMYGYRARRLAAWLDPFTDPLDRGFQIIQGLIAFSNGGAWGMGLGHGLQKLRYLPAAHTDFIFAAAGEELGLVGCAVILGLFLLWGLRIMKVYFEVCPSWDATVLWGLFLTVFLQMAINVGGVTKLIPMTGMPLPFLTYGGSSLILMWARVGIILKLTSNAADPGLSNGPSIG